jgi:hypothetical protein
MKFLNKTDSHIRVITLDGHCALFSPGEEVEVPGVMKAACLMHNLTLTEDDGGEDLAAVNEPKKAAPKKAAPKKAAAAEAQPEDGETILDNVE